jgi:ketosteroid isomerase-like protein
MRAMTASEAMRAVFAAWEAGDADALAPLFCEDGAYLDPLKDGPLVGVEAVVEGNRPAMAALVECAITVDREVESDASVVVEGRFASRLADTGARFDFDFVAIADLRDGRIVRLAEYFDTRPLVG